MPFALMAIITLLWGTSLGWGGVLKFWAVFLVGGFVISHGFGAPSIAFAYKIVVILWFAGKAATAGSSSLD